MLMNSFSTSEDTLAFLKAKYPKLAAEEGLEMMQNKVPKLDAETLEVRQHMRPELDSTFSSLDSPLLTVESL